MRRWLSLFSNLAPLTKVKSFHKAYHGAGHAITELMVYVGFINAATVIEVYAPRSAPGMLYCVEIPADGYDISKLNLVLSDFLLNKAYLDMSMVSRVDFENEVMTYIKKAKLNE